MHKKLWFVSMVLVLSTSAWASENSTVRFGANLRLLNSTGYHDFLNDAYQDVSGGTGWVGGDVGVEIRVREGLFIEPKVEGYYNSLKVSGFGTSSTKSNVMTVPALGLRAVPYQHGNVELSVSGQVAIPQISTELEDINMTGDGPGYALSGGFRFKKSLDIQVGYSYYPIRVSPARVYFSPNLLGPKTYNFGGAFFSLGYYF